MASGVLMLTWLVMKLGGWGVLLMLEVNHGLVRRLMHDADRWLPDNLYDHIAIGATMIMHIAYCICNKVSLHLL